MLYDKDLSKNRVILDKILTICKEQQENIEHTTCDITEDCQQSNRVVDYAVNVTQNSLNQ